MFKIRHALLIALTLLSLGLTVGCGNEKNAAPSPDNPVTIVIWHYYHGAQKTAFDDAVKEFNETAGFNEGIIVEAISYGGVSELAENVLAAANKELDAGDMPDIFGTHGDGALEILNMGLVADICEYITDEQLSEYEELFIHEGRLGTDSLYVFPIAKSTESLMLNKTDFDAFLEGLETSDINETVGYEDLSTWEGILRVADVYYRYTETAENDGKAFMGVESLANYLIVGAKQLGVDLVKSENGEAVFNFDEKVLTKLWDTYYNAMVSGRFTKLGRFCSDDIKTGDSLCFVGSTTSASYFPLELPQENGELRNIEMMVLPMPVFENGDKVSISQGAGMAISKSTKEKEYASAFFLKWFTDAERNVSFSLSSSYLPVKKDALDESTLSSAFNEINDDDVGTQNSIKALRVAVEQLKSYKMYSSDVFDRSADFRTDLPKALSEAVGEDRSTYLALVESGMKPDAAFWEATKDSRRKLNKWIEFLEEYGH